MHWLNFLNRNVQNLASWQTKIGLKRMLPCHMAFTIAMVAAGLITDRCCLLNICFVK